MFEAGGVNLYGFVVNDPSGNVDALGLDPECAWHHNYPQEVFTPDFLKENNLRLNPHDKNNGRMLPADTHAALHPDWNDDWKDWVDDQKARGKKITDKGVKKQLNKMLQEPRYKAINQTGTKPKFNFNDPRRFKGIPAAIAVGSILLSAGNPAFAKDYSDYLEATRRGDLNAMDLNAALLGDHVRNCGLPPSFADRVAMDLAAP